MLVRQIVTNLMTEINVFQFLPNSFRQMLCQSRIRCTCGFRISEASLEMLGWKIRNDEEFSVKTHHHAISLFLISNEEEFLVKSHHHAIWQNFWENLVLKTKKIFFPVKSHRHAIWQNFFPTFLQITSSCNLTDFSCDKSGEGSVLLGFSSFPHFFLN